MGMFSSIVSGLPRRTVRLRLTLLYGGLFMLSGAALLAVTYLLVQHAVSGPEGDAKSTRVTPSTPPLDQAPGNAGQPVTIRLSDIMHQLLINSGIALGLMAILSIGLGWIVAGRMLHPLRTITATVRDISATSLHRRLPARGPDDELTELAETFNGLLDRLEAAFLAQRQFVANASHELRTPLARQRILGQVALSDPDATLDSLRSAHERILAAGVHQERLIEALLTLTRGHTGIDVREPFDLAAPVAEIVAARQIVAEGRGVTLRPAISAAPVAGHRGLTERLAANLVDNALKYNGIGGWVQVSTGVADGRATLTVVNTGPVVPPDAVEDLFQPFRRLGNTRAARADGLGLGLSIVRAIAEAHDATLMTVARPEGGLSIRVTFPAVSSRVPVATAGGVATAAAHRH